MVTRVDPSFAMSFSQHRTNSCACAETNNNKSAICNLMVVEKYPVPSSNDYGTSTARPSPVCTSQEMGMGAIASLIVN